MEARTRTRTAYQQWHPEAQRGIVAGSLATRGTIREVAIVDERGFGRLTYTVESFTVPEVAKAIGKAELTVRRWLRAEKIPPPRLKDTQRGAKVYSVGEVATILTVLAQQGGNAAYLTVGNFSLVQALENAMRAFRANHI